MFCFAFEAKILSKRANNDGAAGGEMASLTNCIVCGKPVSTRAKKCPNCGEPDFTYDRKVTTKIGDFIGISAGVVLIALVLGFFWLLFFGLPQLHDRMFHGH
jgi:predicted nucleic acid-binding Zn ribbon protein